MSDARRDDVTLDEAIAAVRADEAPQPVAQGAAARVWGRIAPGQARGAVDAIRGCADVKALGAAYERGELSEARALLVFDHIRECPACRAAVRHPGAPRLTVLPWRKEAAAQAPAPRSFRRLAVAASLLLAAGVAGLYAREALFGVPAGQRAAVRSVSGALHLVSASGNGALAPGRELGEGEAVRTARGSLASLRLSDGSLVEMSERAELFVTARGRDMTIHLERGSIIVQAAKRKAGHLFVASGDCMVKVTGTVFSVNRGLKGSRVSVLEGQVKVDRAGDPTEKVLAPGDQWTTSPAVATVPLRDEVAWSADVDRHLALLAEVVALREAWRAVEVPGVRYESRLFTLLPAGTVVYAGAPNYGEALGEAHRLFEQRLQESAVLREWWAGVDPEAHGGPALSAAVEKIRTFAGFLGSEVVIAVAHEETGRRGQPVALAEVQRPGLREALEDELRSLDSHGGRQPVVRFVDGDDLPEAADKADLWVLFRKDVVAVTPSVVLLRAVAARIDGAGDGLAGTPFGARIAKAYEHGAGILFAADLERIGAFADRSPGDPGRTEALHAAGLDGLRHLVFERRTLEGETQTQAIVGFAGQRRGLASWLAAPAPMGALDFVSPGAQAAAAFVFKSPTLVLDDILAMATTGRPEARAEMEQLEGKLGLRLREDVAEALGGEFVVALDGPLLPTPSWKLVLEVYDPVRLQQSLQLLADRASEEQQRAGRPGFRLSSEQIGGETYHALRGGSGLFEIHYALVDGYLVAAPSRALVMRALQTRQSGDTLAASARFRALFPPDRDAHVSGLVYQNLGPTVGTLLDAAGTLSAETRRTAEDLVQNARPTLLCAYGEDEGIRLVGAGSLFDLDLGNLALPMLMARNAGGTPEGAKP